MKQRKTYDFSAIGSAIERKMAARTAFVPEKSDVVRRAAVQADFLQGEFPVTEEESKFLDANTERVGEDRLALRESVRNQVLRLLQEEGGLEELYDRYGLSWEKVNPTQRIFGRLLRRDHLDLRRLSVGDLNALYRLRFWVDGLGVYPPDEATIRGALNRRVMYERFERQTANFRGRKGELRALDDYVSAVAEPGQDMMSCPPLLVYGVGGIGKSTLISRFLLRKTRDENTELPFVYLDFDHPGLSISDPLALVAAGLRQLVAQFPSPGGPAPLAHALETILSVQQRRRGEDKDGPKVKRKSVTTARSWQQVIRDIINLNLAQQDAEYQWTDSTVLIVLDSFEEAQYRSGETEIRSFLQFLNELNGTLPNLRLLIVGRSDLVVSPFSFRKLEVGDFDEEAALAYLEAVGVRSPELRDLIVEKVGGNPLTLKLAAALAREEGVGEKITLREFAPQLAGERTRELLVRRNIEHIRDPEVRELALPGMLLRRIDADVIQHVLAPVCGLGEIDGPKAWELYEGLRRVTFLIEQRNGELHFRRDLRMALRDDIWAEQKEQCIVLHRRAEHYYRERDEPKHLAERFYHGFQHAGKAYSYHDQVDWEPLRPFLEDALLELPAPAAAYLARQFQVRLPYEIMERAGREENDFAMVRRMEEVTLERAGGMVQMEEVWREVKDRRDSNEVLFIYNRQLLALRMGYFDRMLEDLTPRSRALLEGMDGYLNLLRSNYTGEYAAGLAADLPIDFTAFIEDQVMEAGVLTIKLRALTGEAYDEAFTRQFAEMAANFPEKKLAVDTTNWRPFAAMLWEDRHTAVPEQMKRFSETCYLIHDIYQDFRHEYEGLVESIANADQDRLALVLQNETGKLLDNVVAPGAPKVVARDFVDYLLGYYEGGREGFSEFVNRVRNERLSEQPATRSAAETSDRAIDEQLENIKWRVRNFIEKGQLRPALDQLMEYAKIAGNERLQNDVIMQSASFSRLQNMINQGILTHEEEGVRSARITNAVLYLLDQMQ